MIKIICIGKLKEKYWHDACNEYLKRLKKYTNIELIELEDDKVDDKNHALETEKLKINKYLTDKDYLVTLEIEGKQLDSIELSEKLNWMQMQGRNIVFLIGGSYGIHNDIKLKSDLHLSFSKLTFPHQLFRVLLLEQLYRSYKILNHERYHK